MEITKLTGTEWQEYRNLRLRALKEDPQAFGTNYKTSLEYTEEEWKRRLDNASKGETNWLLFAKDNDKLVGMVGAYLEKEVKDTATIISVYVPNEERGKGISKKLMEHLLNELSHKTFLKKVKLTVNKNQASAVGLYKKFGFLETGTQRFKMGDGKFATESIMERELPYKGN